ncbi:MAG: N-succinylarginine dihydrolase, partial [Polyangiaceae bacterium]
NLSAMFHRSLEAPTTTRVLRRIFADEARFVEHEALPGVSHFADEGAANHTRLHTAAGVTHLFGWGRRAYRAGDDDQEPGRFPARQTFEASRAIARLHQLQNRALLWQQAPRGIDEGAFHTDVLAVGSANLLLLHELAFVDTQELLEELRRRLGDDFQYCLAKQGELPAGDAVAAYPFNSQLLELPNGEMAIVAPEESKRNAAAHRYLERVVAEDNRVTAVHYLDVNQSMKNGGGPACLRLRVPLEEGDVSKLGARVVLDEALYSDLKSWVERHYRDRLSFDDLLDVAFLREVETALDELTQLLRLGSVYDFQQP